MNLLENTINQIRKKLRNLKKEIETKEGNIEYLLNVSKRTRSIRLVIHYSGILKVTIPYKVDEKRAEDFIIQKSKWIIGRIEYFKNNPRKITKHSKEEIKDYKEKTKTVVLSRLEYWNTFYNFAYKKVTIKNVKSRWGSCSKMGNLNFNYKLALLSQELVDYIVVHELCHLGEMNHSVKFWNLVARTIPHYKELRKQLKQIH